jgi:MYXO-CTERM domain-containing protein
MDRSSDRGSDKKDWGWLGLLGLLGLGGLMRRRDEHHYDTRPSSGR